MKLLITDITYMKDQRLCVAGWYELEKRMIRPLKQNKSEWTKENLPNNIRMGSILLFDIYNINTDSSYPHKTEDLIVSNETPILLSNCETNELPQRFGNTANSPQDLFNQLQDNKYVLPNTNCPSLGAINIPTQNLNFIHDQYNKLKCTFLSNAIKYPFIPVKSIDLNDKWNNNDVNFLNNEKNSFQNAHIRLGLARAYQSNDEQKPCYMQINNIFYYN